MNEKALKRSIRKLTAAVTVIGSLLIVGGFFIIASLGGILTDTLGSQMSGTAEKCKTAILNQVDAGFQILQTLSSFMEYSQNMDLEELAEGLHQSSGYNDFIRMGLFWPDGTGIRVMTDRAIEYDIETDRLAREAQDSIGRAMEGECDVSRIYLDEDLNRKVFIYCVPYMMTGIMSPVYWPPALTHPCLKKFWTAICS